MCGAKKTIFLYSQESYSIYNTSKVINISSKKQSSGFRKRPKGTHGSLTKAGKVRDSTPNIPSERKRKKIPRVKNRIKYNKMRYGR